jgi:5-hydroxyisourate hydrolase-like protein (transthyretin family)
MRFRYIPTWLLFLALAHQLAAVAQVSARNQSQSGEVGFRIAGRVMNAKSGIPLNRARVTITDTKNLQRSISVLTSDDGQFQFNGLPAGKFALEGGKRGFIPAAYDHHEQFSTAIVTGVGLDTENLMLRLDPVAVLSGNVLDESGDPVRHASVTLYREDHRSGTSRIHRVRETQTDDQGSYELTPIAPGTYFVGVRAKPWYEIHPLKARRGEAESPMLVDSSLDVAYSTTYYGDSTESEEATPIPIRGGDHLQADIHLNPVPALHLLMQVPNDRNAGINLPMLQTNSFDGSEPVEMGGVQSLSQGLYEITGIPPGRYIARFPSNGQMGEPTQIDLTTDGQELAPPSTEVSSTVKVTLQVAREAKLPPEIFVALRDSKGQMIAGTEADERGHADFGPVAAGRYTLVVGSSQVAYSVSRLSVQGAEISGRTLNVAAGTPVNITATLVGGAVTVEGLAKSSGKPAPGVMIALVPRDPESNRDLFRRDQSDLDGSFSLRSVIPGTYTVVAIENGWELDWAQPSVIMHYAGHGQTLTIDERSQGTVHLPSVVEVQPR